MLEEKRFAVKGVDSDVFSATHREYSVPYPRIYEWYAPLHVCDGLLLGPDRLERLGVNRPLGQDARADGALHRRLRRCLS